MACGPMTVDSTLRTVAAMPVISVSGLTKTYRDETVVRDVDLEVHEGEIFGIIGPNGAGKTTTVECLQGLRTPDRGTVSVLGLDPRRSTAKLRASIGSQLQESALPDRMRVGEAVRLFSAAGSITMSELLSTWGLAGKERTPFADLSGGQRQRLFVALALLNRPRVVFLDELTQGLDPVGRRDTWKVVRQVRTQGTTVVLVTHFMDEAEALCDRVAVMGGGRVIACGRPAELVDRYTRSHRVSFTARPGLNGLAQLSSLPDVDAVSDVEGRVEVVGGARMIPFVCAALAGEDFVPDDLRVHHADLEDALLQMVGER